MIMIKMYLNYAETILQQFTNKYGCSEEFCWVKNYHSVGSKKVDQIFYYSTEHLSIPLGAMH